MTPAVAAAGVKRKISYKPYYGRKWRESQVIKANTVGGKVAVEFSGTGAEITQEIHAALESFYGFKVEKTNKEAARATIRMICEDVLDPENETLDDRIKRLTRVLIGEFFGEGADETD